ncbi:MAG: hypothetical protein KatS3mg094_250 [Candidatus Parcubacteria bacterium]|nr:MAG: hypothetical protein KatS3mg094_250 [Candidatus Parcubacteria bacterium]
MDLSTFATLLLLLFNFLQATQQINIEQTQIEQPQIEQSQIPQQININQQNNQGGSIFPAGGGNISSTGTNYIYVIEPYILGPTENTGLDLSQLRNTPLNLEANYYCLNGYQGYINKNNIYLYRTETLSVNCPNPWVELRLNGFLSRYVRLKNSSTIDPQGIEFVLGDTNKDNIIDDADLLKILFSLDTSIDDSKYDPTADLDQNGKITQDELSWLQRFFGYKGETKPSFSIEPIYYLRLNLDGVGNTINRDININYRWQCENRRLEGNENGLINIRTNSYVFNFNYSSLNLYDCYRPTIHFSGSPFLLTEDKILSSMDPNNPDNITLINGDIDGNSIIDDADLLKVLFNYGNNNDDALEADINFDGMVNDEDLEIIRRNFGKGVLGRG